MHPVFIFAIAFLIIGVMCIILDPGTNGIPSVVGGVFCIVALVIGLIVITAPNLPSQQEKCESAGFTWQRTDELVETNDGYEYKYICIDL